MPRPVPLLLVTFVHILQLALKRSSSHAHHERRHEDCRAKHDQKKQPELLEGVQGRQIDSVQACQGHGTDGQEKSIDESQAVGWSGSAPYDDGTEQTCRYEVYPVNGYEIEGWQLPAYESERLLQGSQGKVRHRDLPNGVQTWRCNENWWYPLQRLAVQGAG